MRTHVKYFVKEAGVLFIAALLGAVFISLPQSALSQGAGTAITGYAWSDTIGWIDLSCKNASGASCSTWGIYVTNTGVLSGYAWSDNVGWISANSSDLTGCPSGSCSANLSATALTGWLRVIGGGTSQSGAWDGFIALSGTGFGVQYSGGNFSPCSNGTSCAWGDVNLGWIDFSQAHSTYNTCSASTVYSCSGTDTIVRTDTDISCDVAVTNTSCVAPQYCSAGSPVCLYPQPSVNASGSLSGHLQARPSIVSKNSTTSVYWNISNVASCTVTGNSNSWSGLTSSAASCTHIGSGCQTNTITEQATYTLSCVPYDPAATTYTETATINVLPDFQER